MIGKPPFGDWELALLDTPGGWKLFKNEAIEDVLFVITFNGGTPEWSVSDQFLSIQCRG